MSPPQHDSFGTSISKVCARPGRPPGHLVPGDVIAAIDGRAVRTSEDISDALCAHAPGDRVAISLLRDGSELDTSVVVASPQPD